MDGCIMEKPEIVIIAAVSDNGVIGKDGKLPWTRIQEDLRHFRELTLDCAVIMGRKTYQSLGKPLDRRMNIVLSRDSEFNYDYVQHRGRTIRKKRDNIAVCHSIEEALENAGTYNGLFQAVDGIRRNGKPAEEPKVIRKPHKNIVYIIGGQRIYEQTMGLAGRLEITRVHARYDGDAHFPVVDWMNDWELVDSLHRNNPVEDKEPFYSFLTYLRKRR